MSSVPVPGVESLHVACVQIEDANDLVSPTIYVPIRSDPPPGRIEGHRVDESLKPSQLC